MEIIDKIYRFIALRPRSEKEITDYLKRKKASPKESQKIFGLLKKQNLIDDRAFVQWWLEQRATFRPRGKRALVAELRQKGIGRDLIESELFKNYDELAQAKKAVHKKLQIYNLLPPRERDTKLTAFLARNGFSWEVIKQVIDEKTIL